MGNVKHVNAAIYAGMVTELASLGELASTIKGAKVTQTSIEQKCILLAQDFADEVEATETMEALVHDVQFNVDGLAVKLHAVERKSPTAEGKTHQVPPALSNVKSVILFAFENDIEIVNAKGEPRTMKELRKERTAVKKADDEAAELARVAALTGVDQLRYNTAALVQGLAAHVNGATEEQLNMIVQAITPLIPTVKAKRAKANKAAQERAKADRAGTPASTSKKVAKPTVDSGKELSEAA